MMRLGLGLVAILVVTGCAQAINRPSFDGQFFRGSATKNGDRREEFSVRVRPVSASLQGAIEAGEFEAIRYCVTRFGTSAIIWDNGPDADPETIEVSGDSLTFTGTCDA